MLIYALYAFPYTPLPPEPVSDKCKQGILPVKRWSRRDHGRRHGALFTGEQ